MCVWGPPSCGTYLIACTALLVWVDAHLSRVSAGTHSGYVMSWWCWDVWFVLDDFVVFGSVFVLVFSWQQSTTVSRCLVDTAEATLLLHAMLLLSTAVVLVDDILAFYGCFEVLLVLMYSYMLLRVYTYRAMYAMGLLVVYTVVGSSMMACSYILTYVLHGMTCYTVSMASSSYGMTLGVSTVLMHCGFFCKLPAYPLHVWLLDTHVESSTEGSVVLAGVYLKVGLLGWVRYALLVHPVVLQHVAPLTLVLGMAGSACLVAPMASSLDAKRFAAMSSVLHMQLICCCASWVHRILLLQGVMLQGIVHSWVASMLFSLAGDSYEVQGSRATKHLHVVGADAMKWLMVLLMNSGYPCCMAYVAEYLLLGHTAQCSAWLSMLIAVCASGLAVVGTMAWMHTALGRGRMHLGVHVLSQGLVAHTHGSVLVVLLGSTLLGSSVLLSWSTTPC
uniref:NADH-ubiquinone oxidoreductase chain 4 n=1 Tax=Diplonema papillatum TaxID=91374 RepID=A0A1L6C3Z4_9EUGL|nr:NADH dehydrogenase subunit 4 [Diplonema papillatum]